MSRRSERRVAHHLYQRLAFASFVIWTLGTLILFILFAAGNPRPIFPAMLSMTLPLVPAFLIWVSTARSSAGGWHATCGPRRRASPRDLPYSVEDN